MMKLTLALMGAALCVTPAFGQNPAFENRSQRVAVGDLDLASEAGIRTLNRRIRYAAEAACGTASDADPAGKNEVRRCRIETAASVSAQRQQAIAAARPASTVLASQP